MLSGSLWCAYKLFEPVLAANSLMAYCGELIYSLLETGAGATMTVGVFVGVLIPPISASQSSAEVFAYIAGDTYYIGLGSGDLASAFSWSVF
jgi:hypothetical protein